MMRTPPTSDDDDDFELSFHKKNQLVDIQNNIRLLSCSICNRKDFVFEEHLQRHEKKHLNQKEMELDCLGYDIAARNGHFFWYPMRGLESVYIPLRPVDAVAAVTQTNTNKMEVMENTAVPEPKPTPLINVKPASCRSVPRMKKSTRRRRTVVAKPISTCQICSKPFTEAIDPTSLRDGNRVYPACCKECEPKCLELDLHVMIKTAYLNEKIYKCGNCHTEYKTMSVAMKHLRVHTKSKAYQVKGNEDFYVVKVVPGKASRPRNTIQVKSEAGSTFEVKPNEPLPLPSCSSTSKPQSTTRSSSYCSDNQKPHSNSSSSSFENDNISDSDSTRSNSSESTNIPLALPDLVNTKYVLCPEPGCGKQLATKRTIRTHGKAHRLNISALWNKSRKQTKHC